MKTFYAMIDGEVTKIRVLESEVKNNHWNGHVVGETVEDLFKNCGAIIKKTINHK